MDSILKDKIKLVYDKWVEFNGHKQYMPNGLHPILHNLIQEKVNITNDLHAAITEVRNIVSGEVFNFDHSNFWGYTNNILDFVEVPTNLDPNVVYLYPLELKGSVVPDKEMSFHYKEHVKYFLQHTFNDHLLYLFKTGKVKILLNLAHDPVSNLEGLTHVEKYFDSIGIDSSNVIFVSGNDCAEQYKKLYPKSKLKISSATLLLTHQVAITISQYPFMTNLGYQSDLVTETDAVNNKIRKCKFLCFNRTMKPHRYVLAYHAIKNNLLKENYYSFLNNFSISEEGIEEALSRFYPKSCELAQYATQIKNIMPYHIDTEGFDEDGRNQMTWTNNKKELYLNSYINIVSETSFEQLENPFISEKLWKPVINLQPFIAVSNYHTLKTIKDLGFKTFSPFIDESYDDVFDSKERMKIILREIDRINSLPINDIHNWYNSIMDILSFNKKHLESLKTINPYQVVFDDIINTYRGKNGINKQEHNSNWRKWFSGITNS